jgi:hypothetical protein
VSQIQQTYNTRIATEGDHDLRSRSTRAEFLDASVVRPPVDAAAISMLLEPFDVVRQAMAAALVVVDDVRPNSKILQVPRETQESRT